MDKNTDQPIDKELNQDELPAIQDTLENEPSEVKSDKHENHDIDESLNAVESDATISTPDLKITPTGGRLKRFLHTKKGKAITIVAAIALALGVLLAIPMTRYAILGTFIKKNIKVNVIDAVTKKPVNEATVTVGSLSAKTNADGQAAISEVPVNDYKIKITKGYYKDTEVKYSVPIVGNAPEVNQPIEATGRQVTITVIDKITKAVAAKAVVAVKDTSAVADDKGVAMIVLPVDQPTLKATIKLDGYNQSEVDVKVTDQADANKFELTPRL